MASKWGNPEAQRPMTHDELVQLIEQSWAVYQKPWYAPEIEGNLVNFEDGTLDDRSRSLVKQMCFSRGRVETAEEFRAFQLEGRGITGAGSPAVARGLLLEVYEHMAQVCHDAGIGLSFLADYACWDGMVVLKTGNAHEDRARSERLDKTLPMARYGGCMAGYQVHVSHRLPLGPAYMRKLAYVDGFSHLFLALAANSYDWRTGINSSRFPKFDSLWSHGVFPWDTVDDFYDTLRIYFEMGKIEGPQDLHRIVKICQGSTEYRVADTMSDVMDALVVQSMMVALNDFADEAAAAGEDLPIMGNRLERQARMQVALELSARHGLTDLSVETPSPFLQGVCEPLGRQLGKLAIMLECTMRKSGTLPELGLFYERMLGKHENGAVRQRDWWEASHQKGINVLRADSEHFAESLSEAKEFVARHVVVTLAG